jgi:hypothetical protein
MAQTAINEVEVLRFFETESRYLAEAVFNIVADKMKTRLQGDDAGSPSMPPKKRRSKGGTIPGQQPEMSPARGVAEVLQNAV